MIHKTRQSGLTMIEVLIASIILTAIVGMASWLVWSSSTHVATEEVKVQAEQQAREILNQITADIRGTKSAMIKTFNGTAWLPPVAGVPFTSIEVTLPNQKMDIDSTNSRGFSFSAYTANKELYWNRKVRYSWIVDPGNIPNKQEVVDGLDNNMNNLIDEGMLQKEEWIPNWTTGAVPVNPVKTIISRYLHNVNNLTTSKYVGLKFVTAEDGAGKIVRVDITVTIQKNDPKYNNSKMNLGTSNADVSISQSVIKTVSDSITLRN